MCIGSKLLNESAFVAIVVRGNYHWVSGKHVAFSASIQKTLENPFVFIVFHAHPLSSCSFSTSFFLQPLPPSLLPSSLNDNVTFVAFVVKFGMLQRPGLSFLTLFKYITLQLTFSAICMNYYWAQINVAALENVRTRVKFNPSDLFLSTYLKLGH